jgi:hypothetical protein
MRSNLSNPTNAPKSPKGPRYAWLAGLALLGAATTGAATVTLTPAPGTVRASYDTLSFLSGTPGYHREGNDFFTPVMTFRVESPTSSGGLNTAAAAWTIDGAPASGTGGTQPLNYRLNLSRSQALALGPGPHAVKAVVQFPETTVTAEWSVTFHEIALSSARLRAQVVRTNKGSNTLPDTLGYRVLRADSVDGTLFSRRPLPAALDLADDTVRAAELRGSITAAKGTTQDLFALRIGYAGGRNVFFLRAQESLDSTYDPGFTLRQALAAIQLNFGASLRVGPVLPEPSSIFVSSVTRVTATTENGWKIVADSAYGDCPAGCMYNDRQTFQVSLASQALKVCRTWAPPDHPSMISTTCKANGTVIAIAPATLPRSQAVRGTPVRADGRRVPGTSSRVPQLRAPPPSR